MKKEILKQEEMLKVTGGGSLTGAIGSIWDQW